NIKFNNGGGIAIFGNPVSGSGQPNVGNTIEGNAIFTNHRSFPASLPGIDLSNQAPYPQADGVTANHSRGPRGADDPHNFQNAPVLASVSNDGRTTVITGTLTSAPNVTFRLEFFASDPDQFGPIPEGQEFLGAINVTTDGSGKASFTATFFPFRV